MVLVSSSLEFVLFVVSIAVVLVESVVLLAFVWFLFSTSVAEVFPSPPVMSMISRGSVGVTIGSVGVTVG